MSLINLFRTQIRSVHWPVYKGPFELKDPERGPIRHTPPHKEIEILNEIRQVQSQVIADPSPFHLVVRLGTLHERPWWEKVVLRNLGLHDRSETDYQVIPNTPFFNRLLTQIKHLVRIKPLKFPNGLPKAEDVGRIRVDTYTGEVRISDEFSPSPWRLAEENVARPNIVRGKYLGVHIRRRCGFIKRNLGE